MRTLVRTLTPAVALLLITGCTDSGAGVHGKPGSAGVRDPLFRGLGNGGYDVQHYALTLAYDPDTSHLKGTAEITARATQDLSAFNLDLHGLKVDGATVDGKEAAANRAGDELTLRPHRDIDKGKTFRTVVRYSGEPETIVDNDEDKSEEGWLQTEGGALAVGEPSGSMAWFPSNNHPSDKATYDITVTVPKGLRAISNGELMNMDTTGGRTTYAWKSRQPMASYLATLAIGDYKTTPSRTSSGVPVLTAVDPAVGQKYAQLIAQVPEIVEWGELNFGPYPFSSAGVIVVPKDDLGYALETQTKPVIPVNELPDSLVHEIAHQWFGNSVTPTSWKDMWLNEGFAVYAEWIWQEDFDGTPAKESFAAAFADDRNWAFPPADPPSAAKVSDEPVYNRGAMVLHKIRQAVGEDAFFKIVKGWAAEHRHSNASTDDFTAYVEKKSGKDLTELWDTWLYGKDKPASP
ncbi:M1 family metallopeptidase [Streptomyces sp. NBC_00322]|uniref:M1 family metallopeptidase n=1 Tax=Streptomyces sp. NBC_00322 TaxID=2975712 RepID=UPI002E28AFFD|nr:M1 family metallopeptidase [Streptomyces sp. NBC_00322]